MKIAFIRLPGTMLIIGLLAAATCFAWSGIKRTDPTLEIRTSERGTIMPDGFVVWHHLDANGIRFKSITPEKNALLIKFDSSAQSEAAKKILYKTLPHGYVIAQREDRSVHTWLHRLRGDRESLG